MLTRTAAGVRLAVRVQPRAGRSRVVGAHGGALKLQVSAPPVDGAANDAVVQGQRGRDKIVEVVSADSPALVARIEARLTEGSVDTPGARD